MTTRIWRIDFNGNSYKNIIAKNAKRAIEIATNKRNRGYRENLHEITKIELIAEAPIL